MNKHQRTACRDTTEQASAQPVLVGNVYDKYGTSNPIARYLMTGFLKTVSKLFDAVAAEKVVEVGCGEGHLAHRLLRSARRPPQRFLACDLDLQRRAGGLHPRIEFCAASIYELPFANQAFDLVVCCEVLEHLQDPLAGLSELHRVSRDALIASVPREPIWRLLNLMRGKYVSALGNTPGHVQHFRCRDFVRLVERRFRVESIKSPLPWTVILARRN
jgi:2-polyprenyl-3-methyl-5-hydroxy-6-metoxy-1,4-benzoquinol methylase